MKIHEYQAKDLLAAAGATIPRGIVVTSPADAVKAFDRLGGPVVLKAQVHAGGRGKGRFRLSPDRSASEEFSDFGGVKFVRSRDEAGQVAGGKLKDPLVTKPNREQGQCGFQGVVAAA